MSDPQANSKLELPSPKATSCAAHHSSIRLHTFRARQPLLHLLPTHKCSHKSLHFFVPIFLSLQSTTAGLTSTLSTFSDTLDTLLQDTPALESASSTFSYEIASIQYSRRRAALVLEHSPKLQDVLELPSARKGHYQEAIDLAAHAA